MKSEFKKHVLLEKNIAEENRIIYVYFIMQNTFDIYMLYKMTI